MPPEWLDTTSAPPVDGTLSTFRTSARCHRLIIGPAVSITCFVNAGSHLAISWVSDAASLMPLMLPVVLEPLIAGVMPTHRGLYTYRDIWYSLFWRTPYPLVVQSATQLFCGETMTERVLVTGG